MEGGQRNAAQTIEHEPERERWQLTWAPATAF